MQTIIEFQHVQKRYGDKVALDDFNLLIEKGEFVTIVGSSGCGKTTALKLVNSLLVPDAGKILIKGEDIREKDQTQLRRKIGYAIQGSVLFPHMTVEQNISYVPNLLKLGTKVLVMDRGEIQQYAPPQEILSHPATEFVRKLSEQQRRICRLPEERLRDCEYSTAACAHASLEGGNRDDTQ